VRVGVAQGQREDRGEEAVMANILDRAESELGKFGSTTAELRIAKEAREGRFGKGGDVAQLMARNDQSQRDPYVNLRFAVEIDHVRVALFSECSALTIETETFEYPEGGVNSYTHKLPTRTKYGNITLKRGLDDTQELYDWYLLNVSGKTKRRNLSIILHGLFGNNSRRWDLMEAYPCKWTGPDLRVDTGAVAVETVEFAHSGLIPSGVQKGVKAQTW